MARRPDLLEEIAKGNPNAVVLPGDVTEPASVEACFSRFHEKNGRLDVLFNNAGIFTPGGTIDELALDDWFASVNVNLHGMFLCARAAFSAMRKQKPQGGRIINNGSTAAYVPRPNSAPYAATKSAITGLTRSISLDGRDFDIACGQIDIGNARTPMVEELAKTSPQATMDVQDAARSVLHMAKLPPEANVQLMTVMATKMPYIGRG